MKALSIRQPWPWLILRPDLNNPLARKAARDRGEFKDVENRTWHTDFVGPFLIHAGVKLDVEGYLWVRERFPTIPLPDLEAFERGGIVGRAIVQACLSASKSPWFVGPYGFLLVAPDPLPLQPCRGQLGFFEVPGFTRPKL